MEKLRILVTGSAGFIGHHLVLALQQLGCTVVGLDAVLSYYDPHAEIRPPGAAGI